jgi:hypothetical protein
LLRSLQFLRGPSIRHRLLLTNLGDAEPILTHVSLGLMADEFGGQDELFARATAAIAEAKRLAEENREWQHGIEVRLRRMYFRATFHPKTRKLHRPQDFPVPLRSYQPFPMRSETDL